MILANESNGEIITSRKFQKTSFSISASAKAFKILSNTLYTNKIRAIVRELSCNAYDAHVANGNPTEPFSVVCPTELSPEFSIRDYGTGMTPEVITNLYTTYFSSSKTESNDYVGALGLGSKTPFSYTDSFLVTSWVKNDTGVQTEYKYNAYINESGEPSLVLMSEKESSERTGVRIQVGVNPADLRTWKDEIDYVYNTFEHRPSVNGHVVDYHSCLFKYDVNIDGMDCKVFGFTRNYEFNGLYIVMGNIPYPVPSDICNKLDVKFLSKLSKKSHGLFIQVPIGAVEMTPSRESLSLDENTIKTLNSLLLNINDSLRDNLINSYRAQFVARKKNPFQIIYEMNDYELGTTETFVACGLSGFVKMYEKMMGLFYANRLIRFARSNLLDTGSLIANALGYKNTQNIQRISQMKYSYTLYVKDCAYKYKSTLRSKIEYGQLFVSIDDYNKSDTKRLLKGLRGFIDIKVVYLSDIIEDIKNTRALLREQNKKDKTPTKSTIKEYDVYYSSTGNVGQATWNKIKELSLTNKIFFSGSKYPEFSDRFLENASISNKTVLSKYSECNIKQNIHELKNMPNNYIVVLDPVSESRFSASGIPATYIQYKYYQVDQSATQYYGIIAYQDREFIMDAIKTSNKKKYKFIVDLMSNGIDLLKSIAPQVNDNVMLAPDIRKKLFNGRWYSLLGRAGSDVIDMITHEVEENFEKKFPLLNYLLSANKFYDDEETKNTIIYYIKDMIARQPTQQTYSYYQPLTNLNQNPPIMCSHYTSVYANIGNN